MCPSIDLNIRPMLSKLFLIYCHDLLHSILQGLPLGTLYFASSFVIFGWWQDEIDWIIQRTGVGKSECLLVDACPVETGLVHVSVPFKSQKLM